MPLSIDNFEQMIQKGGFVVKKFYRIKHICVFVEITSVKSTNTFLVSIPSKYVFNIGSEKNVYKIKPILMEETSSDIKDYVKELSSVQNFAQTPSEMDIENEYKEIDIPSLDKINEKGVVQLLESYNNPIHIDIIKREDTSIVKHLVRQLRRLQYLVKDIPYTLSIFQGNYLGVLETNKRITCFAVKDHYNQKGRRLMVVTNFERFLSKMEDIDYNVSCIINGVVRVLNTTFKRNSKKLTILLEQKTNTLNHINKFYNQQVGYTEQINSYKSMLTTLTEKEQNIDSNSNKMDQLLKSAQLQHIDGLKDDIIKNVLTLSDKRDNIMLLIDRVLFENSIMMNSILENFGEIDELENNK